MVVVVCGAPARQVLLAVAHLVRGLLTVAALELLVKAMMVALAQLLNEVLAEAEAQVRLAEMGHLLVFLGLVAQELHQALLELP